MDKKLRNTIFNFYLEEAKKLGDIALSYHGKTKSELGFKIKEGFVDDPVTAADLVNELTVISDLKQEFGDKIIILSEESKFKYSKREILKSKKPITIVDPIDGTVNFANGKDDFCIILSLTQYINGFYELTASVVYKPKTKEIFYATNDTDAFYEKGNIKKKLSTSSNTNFTANKTPVSIIGLDNTFPEGYVEKNNDLINRIEHFRNSNKQICDINSKFCLGLELMDIAKGDLDHYMISKAANWDYGSSLILKQAGGKGYRLRDKNSFIQPEPWKLNLDNPISYYPAFFTNGKIDEQLFKYFKKHLVK